MTRPSNPWVLRGLHLLIALSLPLILGFVIGCMKATAKKEDLGPEVSPDTINAALTRVEKSATLNTLAVGQNLIFSDTRRIENGDTAITIGGRKIEVIDRQDTDTQAHFTIRITNAVRQPDGSFETTTTEDALWLNKAPLTSSAIPQSIRAPSPNKITIQSLVGSLDSTPQPQKVTFHHFRESDAVIDVPAPVKSRANCGGVSPCQMPVHYIQFDMVLWQDDTNYQKISIDFAFSLVSPYIPFGSDFDQLSGLLITDCRSTYVPVPTTDNGTRTVYVRDCLNLEDFQK